MSNTRNTGENRAAAGATPTDPDPAAELPPDGAAAPADETRDGPAGEAATDRSPEPEAPADPLAELQAERDQLHNQLQRTLADLQNFRKRRVQEMGDARRGATEALVGELLPVLDNFHLAVEYDAGSGESAADSMRQGLLMVRSLLEGVFERHGVVEIPAAGIPFDPAVHEAMGIDPEVEDGIVAKVMQRGYRIDDRVLRPARVTVGGSSQGTTGEESQQEE